MLNLQLGIDELYKYAHYNIIQNKNMEKIAHIYELLMRCIELYFAISISRTTLSFWNSTFILTEYYHHKVNWNKRRISELLHVLDKVASCMYDFDMNIHITYIHNVYLLIIVFCLIPVPRIRIYLENNLYYCKPMNQWMMNRYNCDFIYLHYCLCHTLSCL